jgi:hypothetical protein
MRMMGRRMQKMRRMKINQGLKMRRWKRRKSKKKNLESKGLKATKKRVKKRKRVRKLLLLFNLESSRRDQLVDRG